MFMWPALYPIFYFTQHFWKLISPGTRHKGFYVFCCYLSLDLAQVPVDVHGRYIIACQLFLLVAIIIMLIKLSCGEKHFTEWREDRNTAVLHCTGRKTAVATDQPSLKDLDLGSWSTRRMMARMGSTVLVAVVTILAVVEAARIKRESDCEKITLSHGECIKQWV